MCSTYIANSNEIDFFYQCNYVTHSVNIRFWKTSNCLYPDASSLFDQWDNFFRKNIAIGRRDVKDKVGKEYLTSCVNTSLNQSKSYFILL